MLLGVLVFQLPKLTGGGSSAPEAAPATSGDVTAADGTAIVPATTSTTVAATTTIAPRVPAGVPRAVLVGVTVGGSAQPKAGEGTAARLHAVHREGPVRAVAAEGRGHRAAGAPTATGSTGTGSRRQGWRQRLDHRPGAVDERHDRGQRRRPSPSR